VVPEKKSVISTGEEAKVQELEPEMVAHSTKQEAEKSEEKV